jgi:undecaprenyl-diphosphatase
MKSSSIFTLAYFKKLPLAMLMLLLLFAASIVLFAYLAHEIFGEAEEGRVDNIVLNYIAANYRTEANTRFMKAVTYLASAGFLQIAYYALMLVYLLQKNWKRALEIFFIGVGGLLLNYYMKIMFRRLRPPEPLMEPLQNFSFPSGHATSGFIFYGLLAYLIWKTNIPNVYKYIIAALLILLSLLIGFSRLYLRMHYPSDVIAGFCSGFAWLILSILVMERLKKKADNEVVAA